MGKKKKEATYQSTSRNLSHLLCLCYIPPHPHPSEAAQAVFPWFCLSHKLHTKKGWAVKRSWLHLFIKSPAFPTPSFRTFPFPSPHCPHYKPSQIFFDISHPCNPSISCSTEYRFLKTLNLSITTTSFYTFTMKFSSFAVLAVAALVQVCSDSLISLSTFNPIHINILSCFHISTFTKPNPYKHHREASTN